jgi:hypothetical protein
MALNTVSPEYSNPALMKVTTPTSSCFQAITRRTIRINTGMLCIIRPIMISPTLRPGSITSKENMARNMINKIDKILGVQ